MVMLMPTENSVNETFFLYSKRDNYILIKQPHQVGGAERKIEYNWNIKKEKTKVKRDLIS